MLNTERQINSLYLRLQNFKSASREIFPLLKDNNIALNFSGYSNMIESLQDVDELDGEQVFSALRSLLLWCEYLRDYYYLISSLVDTFENKSLYLKAFVEARNNELLNKEIFAAERSAERCEEYAGVLKEHISLLKGISKDFQYRYKELCGENRRLAIE